MICTQNYHESLFVKALILSYYNHSRFVVLFLAVSFLFFPQLLYISQSGLWWLMNDSGILSRHKWPRDAVETYLYCCKSHKMAPVWWNAHMTGLYPRLVPDPLVYVRHHVHVTPVMSRITTRAQSTFGIVQILAHLVSRVSRPQFCWGLAILCDPPFFSGYIEFGGVVVKFYSSVEITLYLLADFLLQYVILFQSRDIVKNLVSL